LNLIISCLNFIARACNCQTRYILVPIYIQTLLCIQASSFSHFTNLKFLLPKQTFDNIIWLDFLISLHMSSPPLPPTSPHKIFCEYCKFMRNLPRWYEKSFGKCNSLNVDWIVERTERFQSFNRVSLLY